VQHEEINHGFDAAMYIHMELRPYPQKPSIFKIIYYKIFKRIDLIELYAREINKYWALFYSKSVREKHDSIGKIDSGY
jgi:hypothetical protein